MKIAVNRCYGGFSLSLKATKRYAELKGFPVYFYTQTKSHFTDGYDVYNRVDNIDHDDFFAIAYKKDCGETTDTLDGSEYFSRRPEDRSDPDLIKVIEELGDEANGGCARIRIVDIPDDVEWEIQDYDGYEWVAEKHRKW